MFRQLVVFVILDMLLGLGLGLHVPIILDHPRFLVVSKPSGVAMHGEMNVLNQVRRQRGLGEGEGVAGGDNETLFSVHRLDTPTSGLLVFAKDADAAGKLQRGFQNRARDRISKEGGDNEEEKAISKFYVAVVSRKLKKKMGVLRGNLVKGRRGSWKLEEKGEDNFAQTNFVDLGSAGGSVGGRRVILMRPITGRTHQLRVTMKSLGGAIVGDERYGSGGGEEGRLLLHACGIRLDLKSMELGDEEPVQILLKPNDFNFTDEVWQGVEEHVFGMTTSASSKFFRGDNFDNEAPTHRQTV